MKSFKEWTVPGIEPVSSAPVVHDGETLDFISGHYRLFQLKNGHRFSTDDLVVAWFASQVAIAPAKILDLGSGIGSVSTILAFKFPGSFIATIEAQEVSFALAKRSLELNGLESRVVPSLGDFRNEEVRETLRTHGPFDLITGSPPYFALPDGIHGDHPQKIACRFEERGELLDYAKAAESLLAPGGIFVAVFPVVPDFQNARIEAVAKRTGLCLVRRREVIFKDGETHRLAVLGWMRALDLPPGERRLLWNESAVSVRDAQGELTDAYKALKLSIGFRP